MPRRASAYAASPRQLRRLQLKGWERESNVAALSAPTGIPPFHAISVHASGIARADAECG
jgi:hypothetical protein